MPDYRFPSPGTDDRFPSPGEDIEHGQFPDDGRFLSSGEDARFAGGYGGAGPIQTLRPRVTPGNAYLGEVETATTGSYAPSGGGTLQPIQSVWTAAGIQVGTPGLTYTPQPVDEGKMLAYVESIEEVGGTSPGTRTTVVNVGVVEDRPVVPVAPTITITTNGPIPYGTLVSAVPAPTITGDGTGTPPYDTDDLTLEVLVAGVARPGSYQILGNQLVQHRATGTHATGPISETSTGVTSGAAVAPTITITTNGSATDGDLLSSLPPPTITGNGTGTPPYDTGGLSIAILVNGIPRPGSWTLSEGELVQHEATGTHASGPIDVTSTGITVQAAGVSVATITIESVSAQNPDGDVDVVFTTDIDDPTVKSVVFYDTGTLADDLTAADFSGGGNPAYVDQGTVALTNPATDIPLTFVETWDPTVAQVRLALLPTGGGDGNIVISPAFTLDTKVPGIASLAPDATSVAIDANLVMTFDEAMKRQGTVSLRVVGGAQIEAFDLSTDGTWSSGDTVWTGNPASDFTGGASLCARWSGLEDDTGNPLPDNTGDTIWNWAVAATGSWAITGGDGVLTVTSQPPEPATPVVIGGDGVLTIIG